MMKDGNLKIFLKKLMKVVFFVFSFILAINLIYMLLGLNPYRWIGVIFWIWAILFPFVVFKRKKDSTNK